MIASDRLGGVAMRDVHLVSGRREILPYLIRDHDRTMMAASAAEADREVALSFFYVVRKEVNQQVRDALDEFAGLREGANVSRDARVTSREFLEARDVVRVGKKPDVENEVGIGGDAMPVAEAGDINQNLRFLAPALELLFDEAAQVVHVEFRGADDQIREGPDGREHLAFPEDTFTDGLFACAERMGAAGFAEAAHQRLVVGFEEQQVRIQTRPNSPPYGRKLL